MVFDCGNGIYRSIIAALAGLVLISAAPNEGSEERGKNANAKTETGKSAPTVAFPATEPIEVVNRPVLERPCDEGRDNRESDLCAQWKAADAAGKAAWWAMIATFVTAIGTIGLFWQIKLTREAVQDTGKATEAMQEANELARRTHDITTAAMRPRIIISANNELLVHNNNPSLVIYATNLGKEDCVVKNCCGEWRKTDNFDEIQGYTATYRQTIVRVGETVELAYTKS